MFSVLSIIPKKINVVVPYKNIYRIDAIKPIKLHEDKPKKIKPTCVIEEYAMNRFIRTCFIAPKLPTSIEPIATKISIC
jgi:hypothetical protein